MALENFDVKSPICGLAGVPLLSLHDSLEGVPVNDIGLLEYSAECQIEASQGLCEDEARAAFIYTCEGQPREDSFYYVLNATLRDSDRSKVSLVLPNLHLILLALFLRLPSLLQTVHTPRCQRHTSLSETLLFVKRNS